MSVGAVEARTSDGVRLAIARHAVPGGRRRAVALCTHAMMARGAYLARFAAHLATCGVETYVLDFRGHGASVPPRAGRSPGGDWSFDEYVREDVPAAVAAVAAAAGVAPGELCYIGHSLGGLAGLAAFATGAAPAPRRLVLAAVNVWTHVRGRRRLASLAFTSLARAVGRAPARALRFGSDDEPASYVAQHGRWIRGTWLARDGRDYGAALSRLRVPSLALVGDGDWMCTPRDTREFLAQLGTPPHLSCIGTLRGHAFNPDHFQLLTDARLTSVWTQVADFCGDGVE